MRTVGTLEGIKNRGFGCGCGPQQRHRQRSLRRPRIAVCQGQQQTVGQVWITVTAFNVGFSPAGTYLSVPVQGQSRNPLPAACRRDTLLGLGATLLGLVVSPAEATVTSDIVEVRSGTTISRKQTEESAGRVRACCSVHLLLQRHRSNPI